MAIEDTKIVKKIEAKQGGKSGTYWTITWQDGKIDNIFNADWLELCEESQENNQPLHFTKEKKGNYYNIISLELASPEEPSEKVGEPPKTSKDRTKDEQIERAVWVKELGECVRSGDINKNTPEGKTMRDAYYMEMIRVLGINLKEVPPVNSSLIKEAKRSGAKEI